MVGYVEVGAFTIGPFCLKPEDLGIANGLIGTSRSTLSSLTQAVFVTILENKLATNIPKYVIPDAVDAGLPKSSVGALLEGLAVGNFTAVPGIDQEILTATLRGNQEAYIQSFKMVYYAGIAFAACGIVGAMLVPNCEARFTSTISRKLHGKTGSVTNAAAVDSSSTV